MIRLVVIRLDGVRRVYDCTYAEARRVGQVLGDIWPELPGIEGLPEIIDAAEARSLRVRIELKAEHRRKGGVTPNAPGGVS